MIFAFQAECLGDVHNCSAKYTASKVWGGALVIVSISWELVFFARCSLSA
jgi:hypothetical protein